MRVTLSGLGTVVLIACATVSVHCSRHFKAWWDDPWCEQVKEPRWPFAYQKLLSQEFETKGRTASNLQHFGHECQRRGALTKCHKCEDIACGQDYSKTCQMQVQGMLFSEVPENIPTITDSVFAVGTEVRHRNDFGNAARMCVMLSGGQCPRGSTSISDYSKCSVRCWGQGFGPPSATPKGWEFLRAKSFRFPPQGKVTTFSGSGNKGWKDGLAAEAEFNNPKGICVSRFTGVIYIADTDNHRIRAIDKNGTVTTIAGSGLDALKDGPALEAHFSSPTDVAIHETDSATFALFIADTYNHRIRMLSNGMVSTLAGSTRGYADGPPQFARFDLPFGIAVSSERHVFVADTYNHLVRQIDPSGIVSTVAGHVS